MLFVLRLLSLSFSSAILSLMEFIERKKEERGGRKVEEGRKGGEEQKRRKEEKRVGDESDSEGRLSILLVTRSQKKVRFALGGDKDGRGRAGSASLLIELAYLDQERSF